MLTRLRIQGFKSWRDTGDLRLAPITGLFGPNSSGKSSILQFLLMLKQTVESTDRHRVFDLGDDTSMVNLGRFKDLIFQGLSRRSSGLNMEISWMPTAFDEVAMQARGFDFSAKFPATFHGQYEMGVRGSAQTSRVSYQMSSAIIEMERTSSDGGGGLFNVMLEIGSREWNRSMAVSSQIPFNAIPTTLGLDVAQDGIVHHPILDVDNFFANVLRRVSYLGPLREFPKRQYLWGGGEPFGVGQRGELTVAALLASGFSENSAGRHNVQSEVARWLKALNLIADFRLEEIGKGSGLYRAWVQRSPNACRVPLTDVGFGVSQVLPVVTLCYYAPEHSTIILEQPELHLHPSVQSGLADLLIEVAQRRHLQIIIESHSEHLLRRLQRRMAEGALTADETALYFCEFVGDESRATELQLDAFGNIANWPPDFFGDEFGEMAAMTQAQMKRKRAKPA